jgi:hypothetical protein
MLDANCFERMIFPHMLFLIVSQIGLTVFHIAADKGHVDMVKIILQCERFTEVNAKDKEVSRKPLFRIFICNRVIE